jgi:vacuolar-type H+-ATPase subunit E/Vma4
MRAAHTDMITKMKASIQHQANTTAEEIKRAAESDAQHIKVREVNKARLKIDNDTKREEKTILESKSVQLSIATGIQRMKVLEIRNDAVNDSLKIAEANLRQYIGTPKYKTTLHDLCLQGLIALMEPKVAIAVTRADQEALSSMLGDLKTLFTQKTEKPVEVSVSDYALPDAAIGGCVLIAKDGKIQCSNTLMDRLMLSCQELYPKIRQVFFGNRPQ